jgi:predicted enzyme related to lactoylglutathione lyase
MTKGKVTHFEIPVDKMDRGKKFYSEVFGWNIQAMPGAAPGMDYIGAGTAQSDERGMVTEKGAINGGIVSREGPVKHPVITIEVEDIDKTLDEIRKHGGKVVMKRTSMAEMGFFAYFEDSEGNILGLWQSTRRP